MCQEMSEEKLGESKTRQGFEGQDKEFVLDMLMHCASIEGREECCHVV